MYIMRPEDKRELDAYRATGLTPAEIERMKQQAATQEDLSPIPGADHDALDVVMDGIYTGVTGVPGLLEEE